VTRKGLEHSVETRLTIWARIYRSKALSSAVVALFSTLTISYTTNNLSQVRLGVPKTRLYCAPLPAHNKSDEFMLTSSCGQTNPVIVPQKLARCPVAEMKSTPVKIWRFKGRNLMKIARCGLKSTMTRPCRHKTFPPHSGGPPERVEKSRSQVGDGGGSSSQNDTPWERFEARPTPPPPPPPPPPPSFQTNFHPGRCSSQLFFMVSRWTPESLFSKRQDRPWELSSTLLKHHQSLMKNSL